MPFAPGVQNRPLLDPSAGNQMVEHSDDEDSDLDVRISRKLRDRHIVRDNDELSDSDEDAVPMAQQQATSTIDEDPTLKPGQAAFSLAPPPSNGGIRSSSLLPSPGVLNGTPSPGATSIARNPSRLSHDLASIYTSAALTEEQPPRRKRPKRYFFVADSGPRDKLVREHQGAQAGLTAARRAADFFTAQGSPLNPLQASVRSYDLTPSSGSNQNRTERRRSQRRANPSGRRRPLWNGEPMLTDEEV